MHFENLHRMLRAVNQKYRGGVGRTLLVEMRANKHKKNRSLNRIRIKLNKNLEILRFLMVAQMAMVPIYRAIMRKKNPCMMRKKSTSRKGTRMRKVLDHRFREVVLLTARLRKGKRVAKICRRRTLIPKLTKCLTLHQMRII